MVEAGDLFKRLSPGQTYTPEEEKVRAWVYNNREALQKYSAIEAAWMARMVGMDPIAIYSIMAHYKVALEGGHINNRFAMYEYQLENAMADFDRIKAQMNYVPELDLRPQWGAYLAYVLEGKEFDEAA